MKTKAKMCYMLAFEFINFTIDIYNDSGIYIFLFLIIYSIY